MIYTKYHVPLIESKENRRERILYEIHNLHQEYPEKPFGDQTEPRLGQLEFLTEMTSFFLGRNWWIHQDPLRSFNRHQQAVSNIVQEYKDSNHHPRDLKMACIHIITKLLGKGYLTRKPMSTEALLGNSCYDIEMKYKGYRKEERSRKIEYYHEKYMEQFRK